MTFSNPVDMEHGKQQPTPEMFECEGACHEHGVQVRGESFHLWLSTTEQVVPPAGLLTHHLLSKTESPLIQIIS